MGVDFKNAQYTNSLADWVMVRTLCEGDSAVKKAGETLLPNPAIGTGEPAVQAAAIYERYKQRAAFFNVTGRTAQSLIGSVFRKPPTLVVPQNIEPITYDIDGAGVSIYQQSQSVLFDVLATGRAGLLVDYPSVDVAASAADVAAGVVRPIVAKYTAEQILNWRHERIGGQSVLSLVTLCEDYAKESDDYSEEYDKQIRALRLIGGVYVVEIHRKNSKGEWVIVEIFTPKTATGATWGVIPFAFVGAINNDSDVDGAPLFDIAVTNRKHYQLSADWYNALFYAGTPQPWIAGLNIEWRDTLLQNGIVVGSRSPIPLPEGGAFGYATVPADTAIQRELQTLEQQMVALGARLVTPGEVAKTATQSAGEQEATHSVVSLAAENVSDAYTQCLEWVLLFAGGAGDVEYRLSGDLSVTTWDAQSLTAIVAAWQSGTMPKSDAQGWLQRVGLIDSEKTIEEINEEIGRDGGGVALDGMA